MDKPHTPQTCSFKTSDFCSMKWDGTIVACCFDFDGDAIIGHIDNFKELKHKNVYKLCSTCSPSWVIGQNNVQWDYPA